jgi:hypothetical protein
VRQQVVQVHDGLETQCNAVAVVAQLIIKGHFNEINFIMR